MSTISPTRREARASSPWTLLDLAMACMQFRIREEDQYRTSFRVPGGQYDFRGSTFGLHGMSSVLMRFIQSIFGPYGRSALSFDATRRAQPASLVSARGVAVDPRKVAAVTEWTALTSITDVRRFVCWSCSSSSCAYGRYVLVRWTGLDAAGNRRGPLDNLTKCEAASAAFEQATGR